MTKNLFHKKLLILHVSIVLAALMMGPNTLAQLLFASEPNNTRTDFGVKHIYQQTTVQGSLFPGGVDFCWFSTDNPVSGYREIGIDGAILGATGTTFEGSVSQTVTIYKAPQSITFSELAARNYGEASFALEATASSGLAVTYTSSNPSMATVSDQTLNTIGEGTTTIMASQSGGENYLSVLI